MTYAVIHYLKPHIHSSRWNTGTHQIIDLKTNGSDEDGVVDFTESLGEIDQHQPGQDDNYMLIVIHSHFAFPFNQM